MVPCRERRIRTLGWDGMDVKANVLMQHIVKAMHGLNRTCEVFRDAAIIVSPSVEDGPAAEDDVLVQFAIQQGENGLLCLDIRRLRGDSFRFHALYRDVRRALSPINGWDESKQEYHPAKRMASDDDDGAGSVESTERASTGDGRSPSAALHGGMKWRCVSLGSGLDSLAEREDGQRESFGPDRNWE